MPQEPKEKTSKYEVFKSIVATLLVALVINALLFWKTQGETNVKLQDRDIYLEKKIDVHIQNDIARYEAFEKLIEANYKGVETDVKEIKDGQKEIRSDIKILLQRK